MKTSLLAASFFATALLACFDGGPVGDQSASQTSSHAKDGGGGGAPGTTAPPLGEGGAPAPGAPTGLPCDVDQLLQAHCRVCHTNPPQGGAPMPLVTYDDLVAPAKSDPTKKVAELALARMQDGSMPPGGPAPSAAEIASFQSWVQGGLARGSCGQAATNGEGGAPPPPPPPSPPVCTSGTYWTDGDHGAPIMHPGGACITCHATREEAPLLQIGGTVFPTLHEPTDCNGATGDIQVVITDANGQEITLPVNAAGNFLYQGPLATPYHAKVVAGGATRAMPVTQTSGDCNSCHTQNGANGAPGRIVRP